MRAAGISIFFVMLFSLASAQSNDSSIFFRYAATFDQLLPTAYHPLTEMIPDTTSIALFNGEMKSRTLEKRIGYDYYSESSQSSESQGWQRYRWDAEGRLTEYSVFSTLADTIPYEGVGVRYLIGQKASEVYYTTTGTYNHADTAYYQYNRSGWMGNWTHKRFAPDSNSNSNGMRLYDARGRVIVATNMNYGPLIGTYTYEYNTDGQLIRRTFNSTGSGIILCVDTLEYAYQTESRSILMVTHRLKVAGMETWALLETKTIYPYSGVTISYADYNDADSNFFYRNYPEYTMRYEYDDKGRLVDEYFGTMVNPDIIHAKYYYGQYNQPDSVVYSERIIDKKGSYVRQYSTDVRTYNATSGLIESRTITTILYDEKKKKEKTPPREVVHILYTWK
jgi:hypothetical protein